MWFEPLSCLAATEDALVLGVPNDFAAIWIHDNYLDLISQRLRLAAGRMVHVSLKKADQPGGEASAPITEPKNRAPQAKRTLRYDERLASAGSLNPRNSFENFVVGPNSQLAHAASLAVAQAPAQAYNPLFIHERIHSRYSGKCANQVPPTLPQRGCSPRGRCTIFGG